MEILKFDFFGKGKLLNPVRSELVGGKVPEHGKIAYFEFGKKQFVRIDTSTEEGKAEFDYLKKRGHKMSPVVEDEEEVADEPVVDAPKAPKTASGNKPAKPAKVAKED